MADKIVAQIVDKIYGPTHTHKLQRGDLAKILVRGNERLGQYTGRGWLVLGYDDPIYDNVTIIEIMAAVPLYASGAVVVVG